MAVAFNAASSTSSAGATSLTFSHTTAGSDRALGVGTVLNDSAVPTATYNGASMAAEVSTSIGGGIFSRLFKLENPANGANNVVVTYGVEVQCVAGAVSVTGADQTDCISNNAVATGFSNAPSVTVTSATGEFVMACIASIAVSWVVGSSGSDERWDLTAGGTSCWGGTEAGAASVTINPTQSATEDWAIAAMSFKASAAAGGNPRFGDFFSPMAGR